MNKHLKESRSRIGHPPGHAVRINLTRSNPLRSSFGTNKRALGSALGDPRIHLGKVLVAVDFSDESKKALQYGGAFARQFGASVTLVHVVEPITCQADYGYGPVTRKIPDQQMIKRAQRRLKALKNRLIGSGVKMETLVRSGTAHSQITQAANELDFDLIVIGTRGICASEHAMLGSTAERVVRNAACPVFVVRRKEHEFVWSGKAR